MPMSMLNIYQEEMPKIEASEQLKTITSFAVGAGHLKREDSSRIINQLQRTSESKKKREKIKPSPESLAGIGIGVEVVKKGGKD